jgi:hypothetical protein
MPAALASLRTARAAHSRSGESLPGLKRLPRTVGRRKTLQKQPPGKTVTRQQCTPLLLPLPPRPPLPSTIATRPCLPPSHTAVELTWKTFPVKLLTPKRCCR